MKQIFNRLMACTLVCAAFVYTSCTKDLQSEISGLGDRLDKVESQAATTKAEIEKTISDLDAKIAANYATKEVVDAVKKELQDDVNDVDTAVKNLKSAYEAGKAALEAEIKKLNTALAGKADKSYVDGLMTTARGLIDGLRTDVTSLQSKVAALETNKADKTELTTLETTLKAEIATAKTALEARIGKAEEAIKKNTDDITAIKADLEEVKAELQKKADKDYVDEADSLINAELELKANKAWAEAQFALKADKSFVEAEIAALEAADSVLRADFAAADAAVKAVVDSLIAANNKELADLKAADQKLNEKIEKVDTLLSQFQAKVEKLYALKTDVNAVADSLAKTRTELTDLKDLLEDEVDAIEESILEITELLADVALDVEELFARIQSLVYAPDYIDGLATIDFAYVLENPDFPTDGSDDDEASTNQKERVEYVPAVSTLRYKVNAEDAEAAAEDIAKAWAQAEDTVTILSYTLEDVEIRSRAAVENDEELVIVNVEAEDEYLYVDVLAENFDPDFFVRDAAYSASLRFTDGNNNLATEYTGLIACDEPDWIEVGFEYPTDNGLAYDNSVYEIQELPVNDDTTVIDILKDVKPVLLLNGKPMTEDDYEDYPTAEMEMTETLIPSSENEEVILVATDFIYTTGGDYGRIETAKLTKVLDKSYVKESLVISQLYRFRCSAALALSEIDLTAELRKAQFAQIDTIDWTLQRAIDLRGEDGTPYAKDIVIEDVAYDLNYNLASVLAPEEGKTITKVVKLNGENISSNAVQVSGYAGNAADGFTADVFLPGGLYEFSNEKANVYDVTWKSDTDELCVVVNLKVVLGQMPDSVKVNRTVEVDLLSDDSNVAFKGKDTIIVAAYNALTPEKAGFAADAKVYDELLAAITDEANTEVNEPDYKMNINFIVNENVDNSEIWVFDEQVGSTLAKSYLFKRTISTWFGVPFEFNVTAIPVLPTNRLIPSEDYMEFDADTTSYVTVLGKIDETGKYTINLSDLAKYLNVNGGDDKKIAHNLEVDFTVLDGATVQLSDGLVDVVPLPTNVGDIYGELTNDEAILNWYTYAGTVVKVKATLLAEGFPIDEYEFELRTEDPLTFEYADVEVTRLPGLDANAKVYQNVVLTSSIEPNVANLIDQEAASINEIFARSHADFTYGISEVKAILGGVYTDREKTVPYSAQKYAWDEENGILTLNADDGQLLYPIYAFVTLSFKHNIHGDCVSSKEICITFTPNEDAKDLLNTFSNGGKITLTENLILTEALVLDNPNAVVELDLGGKTIQNITKTDEEGYQSYALRVKKGTLIIKGEGTVDGGSGCNYNIALRVDGPGVAFVEGGYFKVGPDQDSDENHAVYAADGGKVFISGGKFESAPKKGTEIYTTLNLKDGTGASIEVTGGEYVKFNPADCVSEGAGTNFVKAGYKSILKEYSTTDYIVVAE